MATFFRPHNLPEQVRKIIPLRVARSIWIAHAMAHQRNESFPTVSAAAA